MGREHYLVRALFVVPAPILTCVFYDAPGSLAVRVCVCVLSTASAASAFAISSFAAAAL